MGRKMADCVEKDFTTTEVSTSATKQLSNDKNHQLQKTTTNDSLPSSEQEQHYHEWNPMERMSQSLLNNVDNEAVTIQRLLTGVSEMGLDEVLCPFNDGSGRCYKVSCRYKHVAYSSKVLNERPKLHSAVVSRKEPLCTVSSLPSQIFPATGCMSKIIVTSAIDPGRFYVVPENGWQCLCNVNAEEQDKASSKESQRISNFFHSLDKLHTDLFDLQQQSKFDSKCSDYASEELVAVKLETVDGHFSCYRAKVLFDAVAYCSAEEDLFKSVDVALELLDYGMSCVKNSANIFPLPAHFTHISPMAYKCQLFGISPIMGTWSNSAIKRFRELVEGQTILAEVVRTASPTSTAHGTVNDDSCLLRLYIKAQDDDYVNVADDLINAGLGIKWNI